LFDTSVLIAAMLESHPAHTRAFPWLKQAQDHTVSGIVAAHSIAEIYAILTTLPVQPRIPASVARKLIRHNLDALDIISLSSLDYLAIIQHLSEHDIIGGVTYDALIVYAAMKADAGQILTLNEKDFRRIYPEIADRIIAP
jgi:predicted nucleic acid-binding protein